MDYNEVLKKIDLAMSFLANGDYERAAELIGLNEDIFKNKKYKECLSILQKIKSSKEFYEFLKNGLSVDIDEKEYKNIVKNAILDSPELLIPLKQLNEQFYNKLSCFSYKDVNISPAQLRKLFEKSILFRHPYSSSKLNYYFIPYPNILKDVLNEFSKEKEPITREEIERILNRLNEEFVGNDHIKKMVEVFLKAKPEERIHLLIYGSPATGKTLVAEIIYEELKEKSYFVTATDMSKAGLFNLLFGYRPSILIIDEIEKVDRKKDLDTLHSLMEGGYIIRTKGDYLTGKILLNTKVLALANEIKKLRPSILSRFIKLEAKVPTREEFIKILLTKAKKLGVNEELAKKIAEECYINGLDVRESQNILKIAKYMNDMDAIKEIIQHQKKDLN